MSAAPDRDPSSPDAGSLDERIEALLFECLEADDPAAAVAAAADASPELAQPLREAFAEMMRFELIDRPSSGSADAGVLAGGGMPERLGDYRLLERLGAGGMGVVFLARDEALQRTVALKLIRPEHVYLPGARERFQREVETIARLQHPGIVPIYGVGKSEGMPYFTMQHVRGSSLAAALHELQVQGDAPDGRRLLALLAAAASPEERRSESSSDAGRTSGSGSSSRGLDGLTWADTCVALAIQVASALHHAHERGVLHRDVKPSNILLTTEGRALLVDFGLAWSDDNDQRLTHSSSQLGSLPYLPPEHVAGKAPDPSRAADVYALGVTLYEMLTLHNPFLGRNSEETRRNILGARTLRLRREQRGVSWELETVCMTALDPDPSKRYRSMLDFLRDLERVLARESIAARRPSVWRRARRWGQRHPTLLAAAGVALTALLVGGVAFGVRERGARVEADALRERAEVERYGALVSNADLELRAGRRPDRARRLLAECRPEDRGWEWAHLEFETDESAAVWSDFAAPVQDVAWHPDGERFVACSQDGVLRCQHLEKGELWRHADVTTSAIAFRGVGDGCELLAAVLGGDLQVRAPDTGAVLATFDRGDDGPRGELTGLVLSRDQRRVFTSCSDGSLSVWDAEQRRLERTFGRHDAQAHCITISRDGTRIASGGFDKTVRVFDAETLAPLATWSTGGWCLGVAFAPDDQQLVLSSSRELLTADLRAPELEPRVLDPDAKTVLAVHASPVGDRLAITVSRRVLVVYRMGKNREGKLVLQPANRMVGHEGMVQHVAFSRDGRQLLSGGTDQTVRLWLPDQAAATRERLHPSLVSAVRWLDDERTVSGDSRGNLVVSGGTSEPTFLETEPGTPAHTDAVVALLPGRGGDDESAFASVGADGRVLRWREHEGSWTADVRETGLEITAALRCDDGSVVFGCADGALVVDGDERRTWTAHTDRVTALAGRYDVLWSASVDGQLRRWDLRTGAAVAEAATHPSWIAALAIAPDGSWLASSCADTAVRIFDPESGALRHRLDGHGRVPLALAADATGERLVSGGGFDAELRFWQPESGRCLLTMSCPEMAMSLALAPAGSALAIGGRQGQLVRLRTRPGGARPFDARQIPIDTITSAPGAGPRHR